MTLLARTTTGTVPVSRESSPRPATARFVLFRGPVTHPADDVLWGIVTRDGFDELDDPSWHTGMTAHAYLLGDDGEAICGFHPPKSRVRGRERARLGLPSPGVHRTCTRCAARVTAPRQAMPVSFVLRRPMVPVPVVAAPTPATNQAPPALVPVRA
jgi:hypothetical protein